MFTQRASTGGGLSLLFAGLLAVAACGGGSSSSTGSGDQGGTQGGSGTTDSGSGSTGSGTSTPDTVDRTAPSVVDHSPHDGAIDVWSRDPVTVTFSEPIAPASLTDASIQLVATAGGATAKVYETWSLSVDGRTLSITANPLPPVPSTATLQLAGLTDLAGNALAPTSWSWELPDWQDIGDGVGRRGTVGAPDIVLATDAAGRLVFGNLNLSWLDGPWRWSGSAWEELGSNAFGGLDSAAVAFLGGTTLAMAWAGYGGDLSVATYANGAWSAPVVLVDGTSNYAQGVVMLTDPKGRLVLAWRQVGGATDEIVARRTDGASWEDLGAVPGWSGTTGAQVALSFDAAGDPVASFRVNGAWLSNAWSAGAWRSFASCSGPWESPGFDAAQAMYRAAPDGATYLLVQLTSATADLQVYRCTADGWSAPVLGGGPLSATGLAWGYDMELGADGMPVVSWFEGPRYGNSLLDVRRYTGSGWEALGGNAAEGTADPFQARLALGPADLVQVVIDTAHVQDIVQPYVRRYNR